MERLTKIAYAVALVATAIMLATAAFACVYIIYRELT